MAATAFGDDAVSDNDVSRDGLPDPWPYTAEPPQRYRSNLARYIARGGRVRLGRDVGGFVAGQDGNRSDMARFYFLCLAEDQIVKEGLPGDLVELGVYQGHTATVLAAMARRLDRCLYLLDTFEGFPAADLAGIDADKPMGFADTSLDSVRARVGDDHVRFVKGYFPDTAAELPETASYALVHIDCDLYAPVRSALDYFYPRLVSGGFLVVHDYSSLHWNGAERAVDEFFANRAEAVVPITDSAGSVAVRKLRDPARERNWMVRRKAALLGPQWTETAYGRIAELLTSGWSLPEPWGVWGVGDAHVLELWFAEPGGDAIELEADVHAALLGKRRMQRVDVAVAGHRLAVWDFSLADNRAVRSVRIPAELAAPAALAHVPSLAIEFRPHFCAAPCELDPDNPETRPLGMALHRLRCKPA